MPVVRLSATMLAPMTLTPTDHRTQRLVRAGAAVLGTACAAAAFAAPCPPEGWTRSELLGLKAQQWTVTNPSRRAALADALLECLRDPDPVLRDEVAFEALQHWMRAPALEPDAVRAIGERLFAELEAPDPLGFGRPFAALALSEVIRDDRLRGLWSAAQRKAALERMVRYMASITDHRGFEPGAGIEAEGGNVERALLRRCPARGRAGIRGAEAFGWLWHRASRVHSQFSDSPVPDVLSQRTGSTLPERDRTAAQPCCAACETAVRRCSPL